MATDGGVGEGLLDRLSLSRSPCGPVGAEGGCPTKEDGGEEVGGAAPVLKFVGPNEDTDPNEGVEEEDDDVEVGAAGGLMRRAKPIANLRGPGPGPVQILLATAHLQYHVNGIRMILCLGDRYITVGRGERGGGLTDISYR